MTATPPNEKHPWKLVRNPSDSMKIAEHIATLQTEIDEARRREARREICEKVSAYSPSVTAKQWARERGWDCFKEATECSNG